MSNKQRRTRGAGSVRVLPSGKFQARFGHGGQRATKVTDTKQAATAWLEKQAKAAAQGVWEPPVKATPSSSVEVAEPEPLTFAEYAEQWLTSRTLAPSTRAGYRQQLDADLLPAFGDCVIEEVTPADVRAWFRTYKVNRPTARARGYGLLRTIFRHAMLDDIIPNTPCRIVAGGSVKRRSKTEVPTPAQVVALADAMPTDKYRVMVLLAATCGVRFGELTELRQKDIITNPGEPLRLRIRRAVARVNGQFIVGLPKSDAGVRDVVVPTGVDIEFLTYLETVSTNPETLIFPGRRTGGHMQPSTLYKVFYPARDRVGLPALRWHDLRHFAGTTATRSGATLADVQAYLGHSTTSAAMKYQHAASDSPERIAGAMAQVIPLRANKGA